MYTSENGVKWGYPYWILTPNERVLSYQVPVTNFIKIATDVRAQRDRQTEMTRLICPICYAIAWDR